MIQYSAVHHKYNIIKVKLSGKRNLATSNYICCLMNSTDTFISLFIMLIYRSRQKSEKIFLILVNYVVFHFTSYFQSWQQDESAFNIHC